MLLALQQKRLAETLKHSLGNNFYGLAFLYFSRWEIFNFYLVLMAVYFMFCDVYCNRIFENGLMSQITKINLLKFGVE